MILIAISQRVTQAPNYPERRDALDQQWTVLLEQCGISPILLPNQLKSVDAYLKQFHIGGLLLTGGNDLAHLNTESSAPERDITEQSALEYALKARLPILGVCRGAQMLVQHWEGTLTPIQNHAGTSHALVDCGFPFGPIPKHVHSYHNFGINQSGLPPCLVNGATAPDQTVEALYHTTLPIAGIMWHPERETNQGKYNIPFLKVFFGA